MGATERFIHLSGKFVLSIGNIPDGRMIAICTDGSQDEGDEEIVVLGVEVIKNKQEGKDWFKKFVNERPWEKRQ